MPDKNTPDLLAPAIKDMRPELEYVRSVEAGWPYVAAKFLVQFGAEHPADFKARQDRPDYEDFLNPVLDTVTGRIFVREPVLESANPRAQAIWDDIDGRGNRGNVFAWQAARDALAAGQGFILTDYPTIPEDVVLARAERQQLRPYWVYIPLDDVTSFDFTYIAGRAILTLFAFKETVMERMGFLFTPLDQWRVFEYDVETGQIWASRWRRKDGKTGDPMPYGEPVEILGPSGIPVVSINMNAQGDFVSRPPFIALARSSINFYRTTSDMNRANELTSYPTLFGVGISDKTPEGEDIAMGPGTRVLTDNVEAKLEYVNGDGAGVELGLKLREAIRSGMAINGLTYLEQDTRQAETATAKALDEQTDRDRIRQWAATLEDALNLAWVYIAQFDGMEEIPAVRFARPDGADVVEPVMGKPAMVPTETPDMTPDGGLPINRT
jgi:hypothetical protein